MDPESLERAASRWLQWLGTTFAAPAPANLEVVSALAAGADQLAAQAALDLGATLVAPLPMPQPDYIARIRSYDPSAAVRFEELVRKAVIITLDLHGADTCRYEAMGRWIVEHCDVLLASGMDIQLRDRGVPERWSYLRSAAVPASR